jgi:hypothetical protein
MDRLEADMDLHEGAMGRREEGTEGLTEVE